MSWRGYAGVIGAAACWAFTTVTSRGLLDTFTLSGPLVMQRIVSVLFLMLPGAVVILCALIATRKDTA